MRWRLPALFLVLAVAVRLPVMLAHVDTWFPFEIHCGSIALAWHDGLELEWATLPIVSHVRGNVVGALLLWPLYAAFGPSTLVMKIVPLLWHAATVALVVAVLARYVNRRTGVAAGVLLLLAPPSIQKLSVLGLSSHMESTLPFVLALWAWLHMTTLRRFTPLPAFLFGAATGFAGFYHLQALLPCLVLLGLLLVLELPALGVRGVLALLVGAALLVSPSFAFQGGGLGMLEASVSGGLDEGGAPSTARPLDKVVGLFTGDFANALDYAEVAAEPHAAIVEAEASLLAGAAATLLAGLAALAVVLHRRELGEVLARALRRRATGPPGPVPPLLLYVLVNVAAFAVSHVELVSYTSPGASNRTIAPLVFALLLLAAVAVGTLGERGRRRLSVALLLAAAAPGAIALPFLSRATPAQRLPQRGECYEWFRAQLVRTTGGKDTEETIRLIERIDRGDPRFRSLRFRVLIAQGGLQDLDVRERADRARTLLGPQGALYALTHLGTLLYTQYQGAAPGERTQAVLADKDFWRDLDALDDVAAAAVMHGVGQNIKPPPRLVKEDTAQVQQFYDMVGAMLHSMPPSHAQRAAEGSGFALGAVFDPYNLATRELVRQQARLPDFAESLYTGIAWGFRQRYAEPPTELPEGLVILECVPPEWRAAFTRGFLGEALPAEAEVLGS